MWPSQHDVALCVGYAATGKAIALFANPKRLNSTLAIVRSVRICRRHFANPFFDRSSFVTYVPLVAEGPAKSVTVAASKKENADKGELFTSLQIW